MRVQFDNRLMSSLLLYLDHEILEEGGAFTNISGRLYKIDSPITGLYAYATPFKQLVNDNSISGAEVMTGVYLNGTFVSIGQSGLHSINHSQGVAYFTGALSTSIVVSGRYAVKDVNVEITDQQEDKILFANKFVPALRYNQTVSGLPTDVKTVPALYLRYVETDNMPAAFGGIKDNKIDVRGLLITKDEFQKVATCNILKNLVHRIIPYVTGATPFDYRGNFTGLNYSYPSLSSHPDINPIVLKVKVRDVRASNVEEFQNLGVRAALLDISVSTFMTP